MKTNSTKTLMSITITLVLLAMSTTLASAHTPEADLPPLPEWPILGPVLRFLGVVEDPAPEVQPTPDPSLPEYRITTLEDIEELRSVEPNERIRIIASDSDLNQMISKALSETGNSEDISLKVTFSDPTITADAYASSRIIDRTGVDLPVTVRGNINASASFTMQAENCMVNVTFEKIKANNWSIGLKSAANRLINEQIPEFWPEELCVETVIVMDGEAAVEGYRRE